MVGNCRLFIQAAIFLPFLRLGVDVPRARGKTNAT